ncbi:hypothetical protein M501DRAFT_1060278 [Patellaria atrata CBS 101060]|uniref:Uncharacterized protein n=1 Tax=Patellaria atrata CBS 101060 TaxID=1346257 RepID=A0A9P4S4K6_9PEZI|nr:hypothetical protein M501DRAFT_1060278 [Patellaria atrata CBS 101060]
MASLARTGEVTSQGAKLEQKQLLRIAARTDGGIHTVLNTNAYRLFKDKSNLLLYREEDMLSFSSLMTNVVENDETAKDIDQILPRGRQSMPAAKLNGIAAEIKHGVKKSSSEIKISRRQILDCLKYDIFSDVCGMRPLSSINHVSIMVRFMLLFEQIEAELQRKKPL